MNIWNLKRIIYKKDASFKTVSMEELISLREMVKNHWTSKYGYILFNSLIGLSVLFSLYYYFSRVPMDGANGVGIAIFIFAGLLVSALFAAFSWVVLGVIYFMFFDLILDIDVLDKSLRPLYETETGCDEALALMKIEAADAYRKAVIEAGRELVVLDLTIMEELVKNEANAFKLAARKEKCVLLHTTD